MQDLFNDFEQEQTAGGTNSTDRYGNLLEEYSRPRKGDAAQPKAPQRPAQASGRPRSQAAPRQPAQSAPTPSRAAQPQPRQQAAQPTPRPAQSAPAQQAAAQQPVRQRMPQQQAAPAQPRQRMPQQPAPVKAAPQPEAPTQFVQRIPQPAPAAANGAPVAQHIDEPTRIGAPVQQASANGGSGGKGGSAGGNGGKGGSGGGKKGGSGKGGKKKKKGGVAKRMLLNMLKAFFAICCAGVIAVSGLAIWAADYVVESTRNDDVLLNLENISLSENGYIYAQDEYGNWIEYQRIVGDSETIWADLNEISQYVIDALLSTEDKNFWNHGGVSLTGTVGAALNQVFHFRSTDYGGSTIDQQLVKNLTDDRVTVDADGSMTAGYLRKLREIFRAIGLNNNYTKEVILTSYLNTMPLSGTVVGVGAGAQKYFNKNAADLTIAEAATIVGITNNPYKYNPYNRPDECIARRNDVIYFMYEDGKITQSQYNEAVNAPLGLVSGSNTGSAGQVTQVNTWYTDEIYRQVTRDLVQFGIVENAGEAHTYYYNAGLYIEANIDLRVQAAIDDIYVNAYTGAENNPFPENLWVYEEITDDDGNKVKTENKVYAQSSIVVMDYEGRVLGIAGGTGEKEASLTFNRATQAARQVGSTMKMVGAYALGIDMDLVNWSSMIKDAPLLNSRAQEVPEEEATWPRNYGATSHQHYTVQRAVAQSLNTIAVRVGWAVELPNLFEYITETLNVSTFDLYDNTGYNLDMNPSSLILGGNAEGMYNLELTAIYAMYGNGGVYNEPTFYSRVLDSSGNVIMTPSGYAVQAISAETSYIGNKLMQTAFTDSVGTARGMQPARFEAAAKTGTTTGVTNTDRDRWLAGLTPYYVTGIWIGYDDNYDVVAGTISNNPNTIIWRQLMNTLQAELPDKSFPAQPEGVTMRQYCTASGLLAVEGCPTANGYYKNTDDGLPQECDGNHAPVE